MYSLTAVIVTACVTLLTGIVIGALLNRLASPQAQKSRDLENALKRAEDQLSTYQQEVTEHFAETAKRVNHLTQSYREVHEQLASDALKLANVEISRQLLPQNNAEEHLLGEASLHDDNYQAPRDWAPKVPGQEGALSESFGLAEEQTETQAQARNSLL